MQEIEVKGKNVEDAIKKGLEQLGCSRENAEIKIVNEGSTGLFGLMGSKPATILISPKNKHCTNKIDITENIDTKKVQKKPSPLLLTF